MFLAVIFLARTAMNAGSKLPDEGHRSHTSAVPLQSFFFPCDRLVY